VGRSRLQVAAGMPARSCMSCGKHGVGEVASSWVCPACHCVGDTMQKAAVLGCAAGPASTEHCTAQAVLVGAKGGRRFGCLDDTCRWRGAACVP